MKINEIFYSIQGEGRNTGKPYIFVRLSGCNRRCPFCDTQHQTGKEMTDYEVLDEIREIMHAHSCRRVCFTGGEPLLQLSEPLVLLLVDMGFELALETNGDIFSKISPRMKDTLNLFDTVTWSPKEGCIIPDAFPFYVREVKVVNYDIQNTLNWLRAVRKHNRLGRKIDFFVQPMTVYTAGVLDRERSLENIRDCVDLVTTVSPDTARLSIQTQTWFDFK